MHRFIMPMRYDKDHAQDFILKFSLPLLLSIVVLGSIYGAVLGGNAGGIIGGVEGFFLAVLAATAAAVCLLFSLMIIQWAGESRPALWGEISLTGWLIMLVLILFGYQSGSHLGMSLDWGGEKWMMFRMLSAGVISSGITALVGTFLYMFQFRTLSAKSLPDEHKTEIGMPKYGVHTTRIDYMSIVASLVGVVGGGIMVIRSGWVAAILVFLAYYTVGIAIAPRMAKPKSIS